MKKRLLLLNLHSALNLGDAAIMAASLPMLTRLWPEAELTAAANHPESWQDEPRLRTLPSLATWGGDAARGHWLPTLWAFPLYTILLGCAALRFRLTGRPLLFGGKRQRELLLAYYGADIVLGFGGGYLYSYRNFGPAFCWHVAAIAFAVALGKTVILLPQSIGPIRGRFQNWLASQVLRRVSLIMVRDLRSPVYVKHRLRLNTPVVPVPDMAFLLARQFDPKRPNVPCASRRAAQIVITPIFRAAQLPGFSGQDGYETQLAEIIRCVRQRRPVEITIVAQCKSLGPGQDDRVATRRLHERLTAEGVVSRLENDAETVSDLLRIYAGADFVIATRMHSAIMAFATRTPAVIVGYQPKSQGMLEMLGLSELGTEIDAIDVKRLAAHINAILDAPAAWQEIIERKLATTLAQLEFAERILATAFGT